MFKQHFVLLFYFFISSTSFHCNAKEAVAQTSISQSTAIHKLDAYTITSEDNTAFSEPRSLTKSTVSVNETHLGQSSITAILQNTVGVGINGQGGHLQSYSIRGISRQQVMTRVAGMRIVTDRRAGTSASFVDPLLIDDINVYRGASSSFFGSSAIGGTINIIPKNFQGLQATAGYESNKNESFQAFGWGNDETSLGVSVRTASNSHTEDGAELNNHFTQYSAVFSQYLNIQDYEVNFLLLPALAKDIGKSNVDFLKKTTNYPIDKHLLAKIGILAPASDWMAEFYIHPNSLETQVDRLGSSLTRIDNSAFDFGGKLLSEWQHELINVQTGFEYFGRRNVSSTENVVDFITNTTNKQTTLDDGEEDEYAFFNHYKWALGAHHLNAGVRYSYLNQTQTNTENINTHVWSGYIGDQFSVAQYFEISGLYSTGFRIPLLGERFFSGTTARGKVLGNPMLSPEFAHNLDLGITRKSDFYSLSLHFFYNMIDGYIERVEINDDLFTFVNLTSGTIYGTELEGKVDFFDNMSLTFNANWMQGKDEAGNNLNNLAANQLFFAYEYKPSNWKFGIQLQSILRKDDVGSGEFSRPSTNILSTSIGLEVNKNISITLFGTNLLNESYFNSTDKKAAQESGRSLGFQINIQ